jgi:NADH:ubiquinone oxidoreductase subunit 6 (subunit J)
MADIDIQPKKRPVWPWILGIIAAIVIIWIIVKALNNNNNDNNSNNNNNNNNTGQLIYPHYLTPIAGTSMPRS